MFVQDFISLIQNIRIFIKRRSCQSYKKWTSYQTFSVNGRKIFSICLFRYVKQYVFIFREIECSREWCDINAFTSISIVIHDDAFLVILCVRLSHTKFECKFSSVVRAHIYSFRTLLFFGVCREHDDLECVHSIVAFMKNTQWTAMNGGDGGKKRCE